MEKSHIFKQLRLSLKWAIIFTIMTLAWMLLEKTLGWHDEGIANHQWLTLFFFPFSIIMFWLGMREIRRRVYNKKVTWKQCFFSGVIIALFVALLSPAAQYITHNYITPKYFETVINYSVTNDLMKIKEANEYFNISNYIWQAAIGSFVGGVITSAIIAIFLRTAHKKKLD